MVSSEREKSSFAMLTRSHDHAVSRRLTLRERAVRIHERIFDPFWQVENKASRRIAGTGIGLSVARRLARLLGGDVTVTSRPGEGSTFTARIPKRIGTTPPPETAATGAHES